VYVGLTHPKQGLFAPRELLLLLLNTFQYVAWKWCHVKIIIIIYCVLLYLYYNLLCVIMNVLVDFYPLVQCGH
jgi:predicted ferric reductase